ncbi:arginase family protein [Halomonas sp. ISL-56]|uniref:arginase family protein n=1 Tax=Halomonas sp. ISL-56 TaxID=2819149 RepID=UPI0020364D72|nr:arginase family protein [Halomonas sp. ISL-56]
MILDAPSNLGLRPPENGAVPGCYKLPWALRDRGLLKAIGAEDGGGLVPPRYRSQWALGDGDRNAEGIASYSVLLANRLQSILKSHSKILVLGGDCSILLGTMLALKRRGRYGLVFLDAHGDFRHPENAPEIETAAGEDLAIVTGHGDARLINLDGLGPYVRHEDVHVVGVRPSDEYLDELAASQISITTSHEVVERGVEVVDSVLETTTAYTDGFWIHLDLDVVDSSEMPAVDCPEPEGPPFALITALLKKLLSSPKCVGMEVTIYDPDLDPTGACADRIVACLIEAFSAVNA